MEGEALGFPLFHMDIKGIRILKKIGINAIVLYPFTIYSDKIIDPLIRKHEEIHWQQIHRDGVLFFYLMYLKEYFLNRLQGFSHHDAYMAISYEKEAYEHQHDSMYRVSSSRLL